MLDTLEKYLMDQADELKKMLDQKVAEVIKELKKAIDKIDGQKDLQ